MAINVYEIHRIDDYSNVKNKIIWPFRNVSIFYVDIKT